MKSDTWEKRVAQLVKKYFAFCRNQCYIDVCTKASQVFRHREKLIHYMVVSSNALTLNPILIFSSHLSLVQK
jgi:hypothetical protein